MLDPEDSPTHQEPSCNARPMRSALPSPLKSPTCTFAHVTAVLHLPHNPLVNEKPVESPTHHEPSCWQRAAISALPSPLKSPIWTSTQVAFGFQLAQSVVENVAPLDSPTHHWPVPCRKPMMS